MIGIHTKNIAYVSKITLSYFVERVEYYGMFGSVLIQHLNFLRRFFFVAGNTDKVKRKNEKIHTLYDGRRNNNSSDLGLYSTECIFKNVSAFDCVFESIREKPSLYR